MASVLDEGEVKAFIFPGSTVEIWGGGGLENSFMIHRDPSEGPTLSMHKPHPCGRFKIVADALQKALLMSRFSDPYQEDAGKSLRRQGV